MKTLVEYPQDLSVNSSYSPPSQNQLDLNLHGVENNTVLEWDGQVIGYISVRNDVFFLKINPEAPRIVISALPRQKQVLIEVANTIEIRNDDFMPLEVLVVEAGSIDFLANVDAVKNIGLTARESLNVSGSLTAENIISKAVTITNTGTLNSSQALTFDALEEIQQSGKLCANTLIFHSNSVVINKQSEISIKESSVLVADSVLVEGDFSPGDNLLCKSKELTIACSVSNLADACFEADRLQIKTTGKIEFNTAIDKEGIREIVTKTLVLDEGARLKGDNLILSSMRVDSRGELDLDRCNLEIKSLELAGNYSIKNGTCTVKNKAILAGSQTSLLDNLEFEAESILFLGENKNQNVNFITDDILFAENSASEFINSRLDVEYLLSSNEKATTTLKNTFVNTEALHFTGNASLENCTVECATLLTSEKTTLHACNILAEDFWQDAGAKINNCEIKAQSTTLQELTSLKHCKLVTNMLGYDGTGNITKSDIHVFNYIHSSKNANLTFAHSYVKTGQNYSQGILNLTEGSYYQTDYMQQSAGKVQINGSVMDNKELLYTFPGTTLITESNGQVQLKSALFEGDITYYRSKMHAVGPVIFCGKIMGENAEIVSNAPLYFTSGQHQLEKSIIVSEKEIVANSDFTLDQSTLHCKTFVLNKDTFLKNSQVYSNDLNIIGKFCAQKSLINLKSALHAFHNSSTSLEATKIVAQSMKYDGMLNSKSSEIQALENMNFSKVSVSNFQIVKLQAGKNIINQVGSRFDGSSLEIKSGQLTNTGSIVIDNLSAEAGTINNEGNIRSRQFQFRASLSMVNNGTVESDHIKGQSSVFINNCTNMHSTKSMIIQAPLCLNFFSELSSDASLNIDSLVHFNLPGIECAFDMNVRTLLDFNYGLRLPSLPSSFEDIFNWSRALSFTRMSLSQMLPIYSNAISLATMAYPYAKKSSLFCYDFWKSDSSFRTLPYKVYDLARSSIVNGSPMEDASDILPVAMNIMSTWLSAVQFTKCATGAFDEIKSAYQDNKATFSTEGNKANTAENKAATTEPRDLSNLYQAAGEIAIKALGPSLYIQTVYGHNGGVTASVNQTESGFYESNFGVKCGWNIAGYSNHVENRGIFAGANIIATGKTWENSGIFKGFQKASMLFSDKLTNTADGRLGLTNFYIRSNEVNNGGGLNLSKGRLEVGKNILNQTGSRLSGTALEMKATHLSNDGSIAIDNLSVEAVTIGNTGKIDTKNLQFKATQYMINKGSINSDYIKGQALAYSNIYASMHSKKSTIIQAPLYLNLLSKQSSDASLNIDSLIHLNLLGSERAFDMNIRSLVDFNYGLRFGSLPGSFEDVFNLSRAMSFSRMALTQMFPGFSNVISLGTMAFPYAQKFPGLIYDFWKSDASFSDLPTNIYNLARSSVLDYVGEFTVKDTSDLFPVAMNAMSKGLSVIHFAKSATGAFDEIKSAYQDNKATFFPTSVPIDLSNLYQAATEIAIKSLGPSLYIQTVYGYNGGVTASVNLTESAFYESNFGAKCGWNITANYNHGVNRGIFAGVNVIASGISLENSGLFKGSQKTSLLFSDKLINSTDGCLDLSNFYVRSRKVLNAGGLNLSRGRLEAGKNIINQAGSRLGGKATLLFSDKLINKTGGSLNLTNFYIKSKEVVDAGSLDLSKGRVEAENLTSSGRANLSNLSAKVSENINLAASSVTDFQGVKLEAGKNIINHAGSRLSGTALEMKATHMGNEGSIAIDNFFADASTIVNSGEINTKNFQFKASQYMMNNGSINSDYIKGQSLAFLNVCGSMHSKENTTIQALLYLNLFGNQSSDASLNIDSLIHVNMLGSERAYDMNIRSVLDFNYGLRLPYLPTSIDKWNRDRAINFCRMGFSQVMPNYSNVISLGSMALPYVQKSPELIYDFCRSNASFSDLPANIYDFARSSVNDYASELAVKDASDLLPSAMNVMSKGLSAIQFTKCVTGAVGEINSACQGNTDMLSSSSNEAEISEKSVATPVTTDLSSLCQIAGDIAIKAIGPSINVQTVFSHNGGITASANLTESAIYESNFGVKGGWNITADYKYGKNRGIFAGANIIATGKTWENAGIFVGSEKAALLFSDQIINTTDGHMNLTKANVQSKEVTNSGTLNMNKGKIEADRLTSAGQSNFSAVEIDVQQADMKGGYSLTEGSTLIAKTVVLQEGLVRQSTVIGKESLNQTGHLVVDEGCIYGNDVSLSGVEAKDSKIHAEQNLSITKANTLDTSINGKILDLQDSAFRATTSSNEINTVGSNPQSEYDSSANNEPASAGQAVSANQIHASESMTTQNVIFEGQTISAGKMTLAESSMQNCIAKIDRETIIQSSNIGNSYIETNKAIIRENNTFSETLTKAMDTITFENSGYLKTHNAEFDAVNHIMHHSSNHEQTGTLLFKAKNVQSSITTNLYSGVGEENAFYVQSETGNFEGKMHLDRGSFDVKHLNKAEDLIGQRGQSEQQVFSKSLAVNTDSSITIENMKPRACDLAIRAKSINVEEVYKTNHDLDFVATEGKVTINADLSGNKVVLKSEKSDIVVNGKKVEGKTYVYGEAAGDIEVKATEKEFKGKYSMQKEYSQGAIVGGGGDKDTGNAGVILMAGNKVLVDASNVIAQGKTIVSGDKGVEFKARSNQYISERKSHDKKVLGIKHGKKTTEKTNTQVSTSTLGSVNDKVLVISSEGAVTGVAGNFIADKGTDIYAHKEIGLKSLITKDTVKKRETGVFGLNSSKKNETHENVKLVEFVANGHETRLHSHTGNINGTDLRFSGRGHLKFEAPEGTTNLKTSKLNHSIKTSDKQCFVHTPIVDIANGMKNDKTQMLNQIEPTVGHAQALLNSNTSAEMLASTANLAVNGYNMANSLVAGTYGQQLMQGVGFVPKINITMTQTDSSTKYQTGTGAGIFLEEGNVSFITKDTVNLEGMPVQADNLKIKTNKVSFAGQSFDSSQFTDITSASVNLTGGAMDASISKSSRHMKVKQYQNMQLNIKNHVEIEAQDMVLDAANISCNTVDIKLDTLTIQSRQDEMKEGAKSIGASTTGAVSMSQHQTKDKQVNQLAGIHVSSGITKENIQVREATLIGGAITSDGYNDFAPEKLNTTTLKDSSHTSGFAMSGNMNNIARALDTSEKHLPSQLTTIKVSHTTADYKANNHARVFGKEGVNSNLVKLNPEVNTSKQSRQVIYDKSQTIALDVPVEVVKSSVQSGVQFFKPAIQSLPVACEEPARILPEPVTKLSQEICETSTPESSAETFKVSELYMEERGEVTSVTESSNNYSVKPQMTVSEKPFTAAPEDLQGKNNMEAFNPDLHTQRLGLKQGRNDQQIYNKDNGQYTNLEKELQASVERNRFTTHVESTLMEGGDKTDGGYYSAKINLMENQLIIDAGLGKQYIFNIDANSIDLGALGSMSYTVDACSAEALIHAQMNVNPTSAAVMLGGEVGVMGPSAGLSYSTPEFKFMGLALQLKAEVSGGLGLKVTGAVGGEVDASKMRAGGVAELGLFSGFGGEARLKPSIGLDMKYFEEHSKAYQEIVVEDSYGMSLIEKLKNHEILTPFEHDYFDTMMNEVGIKAQVSSWFSK